MSPNGMYVTFFLSLLDQPAAYSLVVSRGLILQFRMREEALIFESGDTLRTVKAESYFI
jgi:hypothetical protein